MPQKFFKTWLPALNSTKHNRLFSEEGVEYIALIYKWILKNPCFANIDPDSKYDHAKQGVILALQWCCTDYSLYRMLSARTAKSGNNSQSETREAPPRLPETAGETQTA